MERNKKPTAQDIYQAEGAPDPAPMAYVRKFYRPLLGNTAFTLWEVLAAFQAEITAGEREAWPTINELAQAMGTGTRYTITGRAASSGNKAQDGALAKLAQAGLVAYQVLGEGTRNARYIFEVNRPGYLSRAQVASLPPFLKSEHDHYMIRKVGGRSREARPV